MSEKKITKAQRFSDIKAMLHGEDTKYGTTLPIADDFIAHEVELLSKKNKADRKETPAQKENRAFQEKIVEYLSTQTEGKTATEIGKAIPELRDQTVNKIVGLLRGIVRNDENPERPVVKTSGKGGRSLFSIADDYEG